MRALLLDRHACRPGDRPHRAELWELYYTLLLKDLGCSSNAARICQLYLTDDLAFKRDFKQIDGSLPQVLRFVLSHTGIKAGWRSGSGAGHTSSRTAARSRGN